MPVSCARVPRRLRGPVAGPRLQLRCVALRERRVFARCAARALSRRVTWHALRRQPQTVLQRP
jgi:hypothetical protein